MRTVGVEEAVECLKRGEVLVYPTETSYALGCDATNDKAVARIFQIKGRPEGKGTPLILPPQMEVKEVVELSQALEALSQKYWPGPLNIVAPQMVTSNVSSRCETEGTQSVRKSGHPIASKLAELLRHPIVATSANASGKESLYRADLIRQEFAAGEMPDAFLDVGDLPVVPASTTVRVKDGEIEILRQGGITL